MSELPANVYSVASVRAVDRAAIEGEGIPGYTLMTRAAEALLRITVRRYPDASCWQILCGAGNNGGDGYVLARLARAAGIRVEVLALSDPERLSGDAAQAHADLVATGLTIRPYAGALDHNCDLIVDALLGTGLQREVGGAYADAIAKINSSGLPVVAVDIPTGLHGDTGQVMGLAVRANLTVTFVGLKTGLFLGPAADYCGELQFAGLGIPALCYADQPIVLRRSRAPDIARALPPRSRIAHKGDFGHIVVVGGGPGMPGAARLCGEGALRAGAGKVTLAMHPSHGSLPAADRPELMVAALEHPAALDTLLATADVLAVGPGIGRSDWAEQLLARLAGHSLPSVWDADALNWLAENPGSDPRRIITPHPGEAARLLESSTIAVQSDRLAAVRALQARFGGVAILKGPGTLTAVADGPPILSTAGNPGMATAGMGDCLTGIVAGLLGQGLDNQTAAALGVDIHARAGDLAARDGERGLLASDLLGALRTVINR